jgi:hypothetical protein
MVLEIDGLTKLIGIISVNGQNMLVCDLDNHLVYTDVSKFYDWINQVILET